MSLAPAKLRWAARDRKPEGSIVDVAGVPVGSREVVMMAGPCTVEDEDQLLRTAMAVKVAGARMLRGGAFKPRTSPHSFRGLKEEGLRLLSQVAREVGIPVVTEAMDARQLDAVCQHADMVQIGSRNMQNFTLLEEVGRLRVPVLLKRGLCSTLEEMLFAAEYIAEGGNQQIVLCERGIRTFETSTRNTLDLNAVPLLKLMSHFPVIVDPSHGTGRRELVVPLSRAAVAAGADGLLVEVHVDPERAKCDGEQSLTIPGFGELMEQLRPVARAVDRAL